LGLLETFYVFLDGKLLLDDVLVFVVDLVEVFLGVVG
jgi:hypothetical protein